MSDGNAEGRAASHERAKPNDGARVFFAIHLEEAARRAVVEVVEALRRAADGDAVRWVRPEGLHVTLRFLGSIERARTGPLARRVGEELTSLSPFTLELGAPRLFPTPRRPRVVVLEVAPREPLDALAAAVERGVAAEGFAPEGRPFRAHLTVGRLRGRKAPAVDLPAPDATSEVGEVVLFESELGVSGGARYTPLERLRLGGTVSNHP